jgi:hypothetical protein
MNRSGFLVRILSIIILSIITPFSIGSGPGADAASEDAAHSHDPRTTVFGERSLLFIEYPPFQKPDGTWVEVLRTLSTASFGVGHAH